MIPLTRPNGDQVLINPDRIERADITPDVVLTLTDGSKCVIAETLDEVIDRIRLFRASVLALSRRIAYEGDLPGDFGEFYGDRDGGGEDRLRIVPNAPNSGVDGRDGAPDHVRANHPVNLHAVGTDADADADASPGDAPRPDSRDPVHNP